MRGADYIIKRTVFAIATVFVALTLNFLLFRALPGSAVTSLARVPNSSPALKAALTHEFGLDKSKWEQYVLYFRELLHGNMGISFADQQPVSTNLRQDLFNTIPMVAVGTIFAIIFGVITGVISAARRGTMTDHSSTMSAARVLFSAHAVAGSHADHRLCRHPSGWWG